VLHELHLLHRRALLQRQLQLYEDVYEHPRLLGLRVRFDERLSVGPLVHRRLLPDRELRGNLLLIELVLLQLEPVLHGLVLVLEVLPQLPGFERRSVLLDDGLQLGPHVHERVLQGAGMRNDDLFVAFELLHD